MQQSLFIVRLTLSDAERITLLVTRIFIFRYIMPHTSFNSALARRRYLSTLAFSLYVCGTKIFHKSEEKKEKIYTKKTEIK